MRSWPGRQSPPEPSKKLALESEGQMFLHALGPSPEEEPSGVYAGSVRT